MPSATSTCSGSSARKSPTGITAPARQDRIAGRSAEGGVQADAGQDEHDRGGDAGDPGQRDDLEQAASADDAQGGDCPQGEDRADTDGQRVVVAGGKGGGGDLSQVAELGDQDDREAGPGDPPEPRLLAVYLGVLVAALVA